MQKLESAFASLKGYLEAMEERNKITDRYLEGVRKRVKDLETELERLKAPQAPSA